MTSPTRDKRPGALDGIRVLELGNYIAAPFAGRILADFGADVIKVERPQVGDELRTWRLHDSEAEASLLFLTMNRNKRSLTLDLSHPRGRDVVRRLVQSCDVLIENFRPGTLERWGLGPDELECLNPELVTVRISGYGQTGPKRDLPGFGAVAEAFGGLRNLTGFPDRPPSRVGISLGDSVAALYAVIGALIGLHRRARGTSGNVVDVALYESVYSLMESLTPDYDAYGVVPRRAGGALPGIAPSNSYACVDGRFVVIAANGDSIFKRLMHTIGRPDLAEDRDLADNTGRVRRSAELDSAIAAWTTTRDLDDVVETLQRASVPAGPIYGPEDIARDEHYAARGMLEKHTIRTRLDGAATSVSFPGVVPKIERGAGSTRWLGPTLGQHTDQILEELGFDAATQRELRNAGVI